jgi:hypothetical protein
MGKGVDHPQLGIRECDPGHAVENGTPMKMVTLQSSSVVIKSFHATTSQMGCRARERALPLGKRPGSLNKYVIIGQTK